MKLTKQETRAMVAFWQTYMPARKKYESQQALAARQGDSLCYDKWLVYLETKMEAFKKLAKTLPEIRYTDFWRSVTLLKPQEAVDEILRYRKEKEAKLEREREERAKERMLQ